MRCSAVLFLLFGLLVGSGAAVGDIPKTINYQGKLMIYKGGPVNSTVDMRLTIYDDRGNDLFSESHSVAVTTGIFNVLIGSRTVGGIPSSVFAEPNLSLGIRVGTDLEMTPRPACRGAVRLRG